MFIAKTPLRISFFGGSTDHPAFIKKYKKNTIINFATNIYTYTTLFRDKFGYNSQQNRYILNYSKKESSTNLNSIKNELIKECLKYHNVSPVCIYFTGDIFAKGSGLGFSSSYTLSLLKCIYEYKLSLSSLLTSAAIGEAYSSAILYMGSFSQVSWTPDFSFYIWFMFMFRVMFVESLSFSLIIMFPSSSLQSGKAESN